MKFLDALFKAEPVEKTDDRRVNHDHSEMCDQGKKLDEAIDRLTESLSKSEGKPIAYTK